MMAKSQSRHILPLLTFIAIGITIGSLFQLALLWRLEKSSGTSRWQNDTQAALLRLGIECDHLKEIAKPDIVASQVVDPTTGQPFKDEARTSSDMFLEPEQTKHPIVQAIEKRISVFSQVPQENGEPLQVLRYQKDQQYRPHHDYLNTSTLPDGAGQRVATMLMYLTDDMEGGETYFPMAGSGECSCGGRMVEGLCVKPNKGDAVLFWSMGLDGELDPTSLHAGCPVLKGEKWSATKWMWSTSHAEPTWKTAASYRELEARKKRVQELEKIYSDMALQKELQKSGRKRELGEDEIVRPTTRPVCKWRAERKC